MPLKAKSPEIVVPGKPKFMISGRSGIGKTMFALGFPKPYYIDTEGGASREQYQKLLKASGGFYLGKDEGSQDFQILINEVKQLMTEKHDFKTLVIDSFSYIYLLEAASAELKTGSDFGRDKKEAQKPTRQLWRWIEKLDMTTILIFHSKDKWVRSGKEIAVDGTTFDGYDKMEYMFDLWLEASKQNGKRYCTVRKTRVDSMPEEMIFPLDYKEFAKIYGEEIIDRPSTQVSIADKNQLEKINSLMGVVKIEDDQIEKWFKKAGVESFDELTSAQAKGIIEFLEKKLKGASL